MSLKFRYKAKEEVPAELQPLYAERDGAFVLDVEGAVDKARVGAKCRGRFSGADRIEICFEPRRCKYRLEICNPG